jgi:hypothetical protein
MPSDATAYLLAAAALAVATHLYSLQADLLAKIATCQTQFEGFKQGVIYGK